MIMTVSKLTPRKASGRNRLCEIPPREPRERDIFEPFFSETRDEIRRKFPAGHFPFARSGATNKVHVWPFGGGPESSRNSSSHHLTGSLRSERMEEEGRDGEEGCERMNEGRCRERYKMEGFFREYVTLAVKLLILCHFYTCHGEFWSGNVFPK